MSASLRTVVLVALSAGLGYAIHANVLSSSRPAPASALEGDTPQISSAIPQSAHIFELRTYTTNPGLLPNLHERFRDHTNWLFVKHGMHLVGYWTPVDRPDTLVYMLAHQSREAREASWKAFGADPEWQRVYKESHEKAGGPIVKKVEWEFIEPTDYSPLR